MDELALSGVAEIKTLVGRSFRNANQVTVMERPISLVVIAER
jgi:hypothetical protein